MGAQDEDDFTAFAAGRWPSLVRSAVLLGCSYSDAEDVAQTALMKTWSHWSRVRRSADPDAYVYRIMINALATSRRRKWWSEQPTADLPEQAYNDATPQVETRDAVIGALRAIPLPQQQVLVLRFVADLTEQATADVLGVAVGTVKSRASRGLAALDPADLSNFAEENS